MWHSDHTYFMPSVFMRAKSLCLTRALSLPEKVRRRQLCIVAIDNVFLVFRVCFSLV